MNCPNCQSTEVVRKGTVELASGTIKQRYKCKECGSHFSIPEFDDRTEDMFAEELEHVFEPHLFRYARSEEWIAKNVKSKKRLIVTAAQNNTSVDIDFVRSLETFRANNDSNMIVIPIKYRTVNSQEDPTVDVYDDEISPYLCENTIEFPDYNLRIYAGLKIQATAENPLSGLDPLSKGWSIIVGHAQVQLRTLPNLNKQISDIITTTGAITEKNYSKTKLGEKANFNHSLSAVLIEFDEGHYHLRHLNYDPETKSFFDIDTEYRSDGTVRTAPAEALITGDEHAIFRDPDVEKFTYSDKDSIVNTIKPKYIIRHDVLDSYSISHHHKKNVFTQYAKWQSGMNSIEDELRKTVEYLNSTTPTFSTSVIVQSNHNEHLLRWLNEVDIKAEPWNAKIYHYLMYNMLEQTSMGESGTEHPDPFELVAKPWLNGNIQFASRNGLKIKGIEVGSHGDIGINGGRGSAIGFSRIPDKMIVGHSHSPQIQKGCYVVGTSSKLALEYNRGASSWHHAHVIIHPNGKRQLIFITPTGWRLKNS